ncbi:hypothetical protein RA29_08960 [Tateyamaria sp. ANG-S1]|nr:hypothetical protein RA29_08960 [Tateyamaria sp. ANG-S1]
MLLCCETGEGRGHVTTLATVARALGTSYAYRAIIPELKNADVLTPVCNQVDRGAVLYRLPGQPPAGAFTWAVWLRNRGYADPKILKAQFDWWSEAIRAVRPVLVVADYAPTALLAARAQGIPTVAVGAAFGLPPATLTCFPEVLTPEQAALHDPVPDEPGPQEKPILDCVNTTLGPLGLSSLAHLPEVYAADLSLPHGVSAWDPYADARDRPLALPFASLPPLKREAGGEIFIYFSTNELAEPAIRDALRRLPFKALLVAPGMSPDMAADLARNPRLSALSAPLSPDQIVHRSRMVLCAGQAGTLSLAVLSGIPVLALPMQHEQLSNALRAAERLSSVRVLPKQVRSAGAILDVIAELWGQPAIGAAAQLAALDLRKMYKRDALSGYRDPIELLMQAHGNAASAE